MNQSQKSEDFHTRFGGNVYANDYYNAISMTQMAKRIASDFKFDARCRENLKRREK